MEFNPDIGVASPDEIANRSAVASVGLTLEECDIFERAAGVPDFVEFCFIDDIILGRLLKGVYLAERRQDATNRIKGDNPTARLFVEADSLVRQVHEIPAQNSVPIVLHNFPPNVQSLI